MKSKPQTRPRQVMMGKKMLKALFDDHTKEELERTLDRTEIITNIEGAEYIEQKLKDD